MNFTVISQYVQSDEISRSFSVFYEIWVKFKNLLDIDEILEGTALDRNSSMLKEASFDESIIIIGMIVGKLSLIAKLHLIKIKVNDLLIKLIQRLNQSLSDSADNFEEEFKIEITNLQKKVKLSKISSVYYEEKSSYEVFFELISTEFTNRKITCLNDLVKVYNLFNEKVILESKVIQKKLDNAQIYIYEIFGVSNELALFVTELSLDLYLQEFIQIYGSKVYYEYLSKTTINISDQETIENLRKIEEKK